MKTRLFIFYIITLISLSALTGCKKEDEEEFITVDVFSYQANYQGIQGGWFGKVIQEKFNMELNIIAPNKTGGGDTLYQTRFAAGNLGDIVMIGAENGQLADAVNAGLLIDMAKFQSVMPNAMKYQAAIEMVQNTIDKKKEIYAIPSRVTTYSATDISEGPEPTFGPYLRWDLYEQIGFPKMETLEDLLPVLKQMQEAYPKSSTGQKTYGFSLFKDWDGNMMVMAKQPACFYGYDEVGFVLSKADGTDNSSIIDHDSPYIRSLRLYFEANQMGLVDPESPTQNWETMWSKYENGSILFSPWPWLAQDAYNSVENLESGSGYMLASIEDMKIFSFGATPAGSTYVIGIGKNAKYPERLAKFIDWLYSPEGIMLSTSQIGSTSGPEGLTWEMVNGRPQLTEFGIQAILKGGAMMPESWGGGSWSDGISQLNFTTVITKEINPNTGFPYDFRYWDSYIEFTSTPVHESWQEKMNAITTIEYLEKENKIIIAPGTDYVAPTEPEAISILRAEVKEVIQDYSWKMVFAKDQIEFAHLLKQMQEKAIKLGYNQVLEYDLRIARELNEARDEVRNN